MATKQVCDRCGNECGCWVINRTIRFPEGIFWEYSTKDLCNECVKELNKFMKGAKVMK